LSHSNQHTTAPRLLGEGGIEFSPWKTPFESHLIEIERLEYDFKRGLRICVYDVDTDIEYVVYFTIPSAFRLLDEHGLCEIWDARAAHCVVLPQNTFKVRNHLWTRESPISFLESEGWSFVLATQSDCVEVVSGKEPVMEASPRTPKSQISKEFGE